MGGREQVFVIIMIFEGIEGGCFSGIIVVYLLNIAIYLFDKKEYYAFCGRTY